MFDFLKKIFGREYKTISNIPLAKSELEEKKEEIVAVSDQPVKPEKAELSVPETIGPVANQNTPANNSTDNPPSIW